MTTQPEALRLADAIEQYNAGVHSQAIYEDYSKAAAELRRLYAELKECQDQRRAAFRRIEELDRELDAMRAQAGQGIPVAWWIPEFENPLVGVGPKQPLLYPDAKPLGGPGHIHTCTPKQPMQEHVIDCPRCGYCCPQF